MKVEYEENPLKHYFTNDEIEAIAEERTFARIKELYSYDYIIDRVKLLTKNQNDEVFSFISNTLEKFYRNEPLNLLTKNHLRSYLSHLGFNNIYREQYEKLERDNAPSLLETFNKLPETSEAFNDLVKSMKEKPHLLNEFFKDPIIKVYKIKEELLKYIEK